MKKLLKLTALMSLFIALSFVPTNNKTIIVLDAGHGGKDLGAQNDGFSEKDYTLAIAKQIVRQNQNKNIEFVLTRDGDQFISLDERTQKINQIKPDLMISIHLNNAQNTDTNGIEFYVSNENPQYDKSMKYAEMLSENFGNSIFNNRGVKDNRFYILRNSDCPAIIANIGFLSNRKDRDYLKSEGSKIDIADKILSFIDGLNH